MMVTPACPTKLPGVSGDGAKSENAENADNAGNAGNAEERRQPRTRRVPRDAGGPKGLGNLAQALAWVGCVFSASGLKDR